MPIDIRTITETDAAAASALAQASFRELAAADWEPQARQVFLEGASLDALAEKLRGAACAIAAFTGENMIGFLHMPAPNLLGMLFVHPQWLRQGIARALWEAARVRIESVFPTIKTVELNATPYAVPFYLSVGFMPISAEFKREGSRATRMACWLPARALGAECVPARLANGSAQKAAQSA